MKYLFYFFIFLVSSSLYGVAPGTYCSTTPIDFTVKVREYDAPYWGDWVENIPVSEDLSFCLTVPDDSYSSVSFSSLSIQTPSDIILPIKDQVGWYAATAWNVFYPLNSPVYYDSACSIVISLKSSYVGPIYRSVYKGWAGSFGDVNAGTYSCVYLGSFSLDGDYLAPTVAQEELNKTRRYEVTLSSGEYTWQASDPVDGSFYSGSISVPTSGDITYTNTYYGYFSSTLSTMSITAANGQSMPYRLGASGFTPATNEFSLLNSSITGPSYEVDPGDPPDDIDDTPEIEVPDVPDPTLEEFPDSDPPSSLPTPDPNDTDPLLTISANLVLSSNELASSINDQSNLLKTGFNNMASLQGALKSQTAEGFNAVTASVNAQTKKQVQIGNAILQGQHDQTGKLLEGMNNITRSVDGLKGNTGGTGDDSGEGSFLRELVFGGEPDLPNASGIEGKVQQVMTSREGEIYTKLVNITGNSGSVDEAAPPACGPCTGFPTITILDKPYILDPFIQIPSFAGMASSCYNFLSYLFIFSFVYKCVSYSPPLPVKFGYYGVRSAPDLAPAYSQAKNNIVTTAVLTIMIAAYASLFFWIFSRSGGITSSGGGNIMNAFSTFSASNPVFCSISQFVPIGLLISYSLSFLLYTIFYKRILIGAQAIITYIRSI